jgi:chromosome segregation ATPase
MSEVRSQSAEGRKADAKPAAPSPELVERFRQFEARVDDAVRLIGELRQQKRGLETRLDEATRARAEAVRRIDALIDKIDGLL